MPKLWLKEEEEKGLAIIVCVLPVEEEEEGQGLQLRELGLRPGVGKTW